MSEKFEISNAEWKYAQSREIRSTAAPQRTGVARADMTCRSCGHAFRAFNGSGLKPVYGRAVLVTCPKCKQMETVKFSEFEK